MRTALRLDKIQLSNSSDISHVDRRGIGPGVSVGLEAVLPRGPGRRRWNVPGALGIGFHGIPPLRQTIWLPPE